MPALTRCERLLLAALLALTGCSAVTGTRRTVFTPTEGPAVPLVTDPGYKDYVGVIHIHTRYSDGAGTYEDLARVANAQGLDYLIVTDHNTLQPLRDGKQGWHGTTLILVGMEISTRAGHYLAVNVSQDIDRSHLNAQEIINEVARQGGLGFIAHPYFKKRRWTDWTVKGFTGIEAYNVAHDTLDENKLRLALWTLTAPAEPFYLSLIDRPYDPLMKWDEMIAQHGRVVGIGSSDAHEFRVLGLKFAPYEIMFQLIRTHLLIPADTLTDQGLYDALRKGHAYLSIELLGEAKGFTFEADNGERTLGIMGDRVSLVPGLALTASAPTSSQFVLFKDGRPVASKTTQRWRVPIAASGVYRIEVSRNGKPWIFSNPMYVTPAEPSADTVKQ